VTSGDHILLHLTASGLPAGAHGAHLHTTGRCDAPASHRWRSSQSGRASARHRKPRRPHLGDLPNLIVKDDGTGELTVPVSVARADFDARVFDTDGTAIVIHAGPDDYKTDPSGNSGGRIACGVFARP
jgi:Cu-Zn family superoxide dismutase